MDTQAIDEAAAEAFAAAMVGHLHGASVALLCSIGDQTGLFDALAEGAATGERLADRTGLAERYVREWLGGVVAGGVVEYDPGSGVYTLPPERAAVLTSAAGPDNLAKLMRFIPMLGEVEQPVLERFRAGGGLPYSAYPRFHRVMADSSAATFDTTLIDGVLPLADGLPERLAHGIAVADLGCGRGRALNLMARAFPASVFTGYDFEPDAVESGCAEAAEWGLTNASFELRDVATLQESEVFDLVTAFDAIHDQAQPAVVLERAYRALKPGGTFLMIDIKADSRLDRNLDHPFAAFLYTISLMHCMPVSLGSDGVGLGAMWGRQRAIGMLDDAGFSDVEVKDFEDDPVNSYYVARRQAG